MEELVRIRRRERGRSTVPGPTRRVREFQIHVRDSAGIQESAVSEVCDNCWRRDPRSVSSLIEAIQTEMRHVDLARAHLTADLMLALAEFGGNETERYLVTLPHMPQSWKPVHRDYRTGPHHSIATGTAPQTSIFYMDVEDHERERDQCW